MTQFHLITTLTTEAEAHTLAEGLGGGEGTEIETATIGGHVCASIIFANPLTCDGVRSELDGDDRVTFYRSRGSVEDALEEAIGEEDPAHTI